MTRRLPPLNALKAFEASARHESFTRAAVELSVTQGAVSHQVKALETQLGIRLFTRDHRRLGLTESGRAYLEVVRDAFDRLAYGTEQLLQRQSAGVLTVSTSPDFAAKWLVNRLGSFVDSHPEIDLRISATTHQVDFAREHIDVAVRHGDGKWPGLEAVSLCAEELFPICAPRVAARLKTARDLHKVPLLHLEGSDAWSAWLTAAGVSTGKLTHGPTFNRASMLLDAAIQGQGVALARTVLSAADLIEGRLVRPFQTALAVSNRYWIVYPRAVASVPKVGVFREWLLGEAAADARRLKSTAGKAQGRDLTRRLDGSRH